MIDEREPPESLSRCSGLAVKGAMFAMSSLLISKSHLVFHFVLQHSNEFLTQHVDRSVVVQFCNFRKIQLLDRGKIFYLRGPWAQIGLRAKRSRTLEGVKETTLEKN